MEAVEHPLVLRATLRLPLKFNSAAATTVQKGFNSSNSRVATAVEKGETVLPLLNMVDLAAAPLRRLRFLDSDLAWYHLWPCF